MDWFNLSFTEETLWLDHHEQKDEETWVNYIIIKSSQRSNYAFRIPLFQWYQLEKTDWWKYRFRNTQETKVPRHYWAPNSSRTLTDNIGLSLEEYLDMVLDFEWFQKYEDFWWFTKEEVIKDLWPQFKTQWEFTVKRAQEFSNAAARDALPQAI